MNFLRRVWAAWLAPRSALEKGLFGGIAAAGAYLSIFRAVTDSYLYVVPFLLFLNVAIAAAWVPTKR